MIGVERLSAAIDAAIDRVPARELARAAEALSARYRDPEAAVADRPLTDAERAAYLAVRAPATYAAVSAVLRELAARCPQLVVRRVLDLGAGPGVGVWAALTAFPDITDVTLIERDRAFATLGREILDASGLAAGRRIEWQSVDLRDRALTLAPHDLVLLSYALGELPQAATFAGAPRPTDAPTRPSSASRSTSMSPADAADTADEPVRDAWTRVVDAAWRAALGALVVIEPGTPHHVAGVLDVRARLLAQGATIAAPCPHAGPCPMAAAGDWCHVSVRLPRTRQHRRLKAGTLSYEDEKFSYLVATRESAADPAAARIVRHPRFEKGRVMLTLCTPEGLVTDTIGRRDAEVYRRARKARWGDAWGERLRQQPE